MTRSTTRRLASPLLGTFFLLGTALALPAGAQPAPGNVSSCSLPATSRKEGLINLPVGEDEGFFGGKSIGQPAIAFLLDTSENMRKLILDVTDPLVIGSSLVPGNPPGPTARGCANTTLNSLTYQANPCKDDHDVSINGGGCNRGLPTKPLGGLYDPTYSYRNYGSAGNIFDDNKYYVHDYGWGAVVNNPQNWGSGAAACTAAGVTDPIENPACAICLDSRGYYIPLNMSVTPFYRPEVPPRPVFKGRWLNFYPPRYLVGRTVFLQLYGSFQTSNLAHQSQFRTVGVAENGNVSCFSKYLDAGFDGKADGIVDMGPGSSTKYRGLCGGGPANSYWPQTYGVTNMFSSPVAAPACPANLVAPYIPSDAPPGTTAVIFKQDADLQCHAYFSADGVNPTARAICAPYAEAILQAGATLAETPAIYDQYFTFQNAAPGTWKYYNGLSDQGICTPSSTYPCAKGVVILVAGGKPSFDDNLPCEITGGIAGCPSLVSSATACGGSGPGPSANLPRTANFMANHNFMPSGGWDGGVNVQTYVVGFGVGDPALLAAADEGKGKYISATSPDSLKAGILEAVRLASTAQITFSSAAFSAVQSKSTSQLLVPRFTPKINKSIWPGKLYAYRVVSEDACGCKKAGATDPCDYNKDGFCGGVFFQDAAGSFIAANPNGVFEKATLAGGVFTPNGTAAVEDWEAGAKLTAKTSANRKIFTVIDADGANNADGLFDYRDKVIEFNTANADRLAPYLTSGPGDMCLRLGSRLNTCLDTVACAARIIDYVRGKDLFNENCNNATVDRVQMLGDIYHSAPIIVDPPLDSKNQVCGLGLANQCVVSIYKTETPKVPTTAYDDYAKLNARRDKVALVGSNDGIFHAFRTGRWIDCTSPGVPTGCIPGVGYYDNGDGDERWAFIPPDMLPKLERLIENERELYVDGTPMVRDVWADGSDGSTPDGKKEPGEFHTVAVVGERRGGTHFFALDVSNPDGPVPESTGFFRWMWPQPNTVADRLAGQSYNDYLPSSPPIGPVRLKNTLINGLDTYFTDVDPPDTPLPPVKFEERWIVLLPGGYDAAKQRGHTVDMVDVWYGGQGVVGNNANPRLAIWTFNPLTQNPGLGIASSVYSFAATPGMVGFGPKNTNVTYTQNKFFFDTATIGDLGGQLWTLRFNDPDPANWAGARAFRNDSTASPNDCARQPFFNLTSNVVASQGGHLRTLLGSGDRANLTDLNGGECSWDNLLACLRRGCDVDITYSLSNACGSNTTFTRSWTGGQANNCNAGAENESPQIPALNADCCAPGGANDLNGSFTVELTNCPSGPGIIKWIHQATCKAVAANTATMCGTGQPQTYICDTISKTPIAINTIWAGYNQAVNNMPDNGFYSIKIFDPVAGRRNFNNPTVAKIYDGNALKQSNLILVNPLQVTGAAAITDPGWAAKYVHGAPTHVSKYPFGFAGLDVNERTATGSTVVGGCAFWSSYIPSNTTPACVAATTGLNTQYNLNYITGGACTGLDPNLASGSYSQSTTTSPPVPPQLTEFLSPDGTMNITLVGVPRQQGGAAEVTQVAQSNELIREAYTLDVPRPTHTCRHAPGSTIALQRTAAKANCY